MWDPTAPPYVRAQNYVDDNPPAVLADEFFNPVQDDLAYLFGGITGISTSLTCEEFVKPQPVAVPAAGDAFGAELAVVTNPGGNFEIQTITPGAANQHGVYEVHGTAPGDRGAGTLGFEVADARYYIGTRKFIFCARVRISKIAVNSDAPPGFVVGLGRLSDNYPSWVADASTGFWVAFWDGGTVTSTFATVDNEWITLWVARKDSQVRWYAKLDADPAATLVTTQTLATPSLTGARRYVRHLVKNTAIAADNYQIDKIALAVER